MARERSTVRSPTPLHDEEPWHNSEARGLPTPQPQSRSHGSARGGRAEPPHDRIRRGPDPRRSGEATPRPPCAMRGVALVCGGGATVGTKGDRAEEGHGTGRRLLPPPWRRAERPDRCRSPPLSPRRRTAKPQSRGST
jgi:hypothetical protein